MSQRVTGLCTSNAFLLLASVHPRTLSETRFCVLARHLGMFDSYGPNYQRGRYWSVPQIIDDICHPLRRSDLKGGKFAVKNVPLPIRQLLVAESASNDGLAYPFLSIAIYLTTEASRGTAFEKWLVISWICL